MAKNLILGLMLATILALVVGCGGGSDGVSAADIERLEDRVRALEYDALWLHRCTRETHQHGYEDRHRDDYPQYPSDWNYTFRTTDAIRACEYRPTGAWVTGDNPEFTKGGEVWERLDGDSLDWPK